jgi:hypothetical protein
MADSAPPVILTWNFPNWVTITIMALMGFMVFSLIAGFVTKSRKTKSAE